ncbi:MAG TPA: sugar transferase [Chloroflexota bacterium]
MTVVRQSVDAPTGARLLSSRKIVPIVVVVCDSVMIYSAFVLAYWVRYALKVGPHIQESVSFSGYQPVALFLLGIMIPLLAVKGAYRSRLSRDVVDEAGLIFSTATITVASIVVITAMLHDYQYSRGVILYVWVLVIAMVVLGRALFRSVQGACFRYGIGVRRLLVVGTGDVAKMVMQSVVARTDLGYRLVGFVAHRGATQVEDFGRFRALGTVADVPALVEDRLIDEVIIALPASAHEEVWPVLSLCERHGVSLKLVPDLFEMSLSRVEVDDIAGIPLLDVQERPLRRIARAAKRVTDILVAGLVGLICLPFLLVLGALIRLENPGPALLRQVRVGKDGRRFTCLKLRTMRPDAALLQTELEGQNESRGPLFKMRDDPRCTRIGRYVRRWSLDELPQLWNVVKGDMSLVGPRPPLPSEVERYDERHLRRLEIHPGMTGIWQVSGRSDLPFDEMVMMDIYYVDNWSIALDIRILIRTILAVMTRHGAY